jgi:hypothetical protein
MPRGLLIFALCLPLAILLGFLLADPLVESNRMMVGGALLALLIPIILAIHQRALIWVTGAFINAFFLPGQPQMWMLVAALSFTITILSRPLRKVKMQPVWDKWTLIFLSLFIAAVIFTAMRSGGIGLRILGSSVFGGRKYVMLLAAFVGFLALTFQPAQRKHAQKDLTIWALGPATSAVSNLAYMLGPSFYFLFLLFPVEMALNQAQVDLAPVVGGIKRYTGFSSACAAICMCCMLRWGIKGMLQPAKPWRLGILVFAFGLGMLSGFRSAILIPLVTLIVQFFAEGLHKTKYAIGLAGFAAACVIFLAAFSQSLPLAAQRAISFLPVRVDPVAAIDAQNSMAWRLEMWHVVIQEVPEHIWFGKGYALDPTDIYMAEESVKRGFQKDYEMFVKAGDYHSGPLSVLVPFGVVGATLLILFLIAAVRVLYRNFKHGDVAVRNINVTLFSSFVARLIYFTLFFGGVEADLWLFASTVGIGLAVNGGVAGVEKREARQKPAQVLRGRRRTDEELQPA